MKKILLFALVVMSIVNVKAQGVYDIDNITLIEIEFAESDWDAILDDYYENDLEERLIGTVTVNGESFDSVGVAFKGNSTYNPTNAKNPLNIKLDYVLDQTYQGYGTFKLSNGNKDPSFVREVLSYEIGRKYMDMPLSNYAKVIVNGDYYGLFSSSEAIDGDYLERRLYTGRNSTRFKCNPVSVFDGGSSLEYLGTDSSDYFDFYELKSEFGWNELAAFTNNLAFSLPLIEQYLDVDRALWMLAFNSTLVNLDSYTGPFQQNYYLIKDENGRFLPIVWDLNESFGAFSMISSGGGPGGPSDVSDLNEMDLFLRSDDATFPLIQQLLSVPRYKKMYLAHVKTMVEENFADGSYFTRAEAIQSVIASEQAADPNGFYSAAEFADNLDETTGGGGGPGPGSAGVYGLSQVIDPRVDYLEGLTEWGYIAPTITDVAPSLAVITPYSTVTITATISDANYAYLGFRNDWEDAFTKIEMFDDGLHGDGGADDGVYGVSLALEAKDVQYYIYADNDEAGKFSPQRAEHEFYNLVISSPIVINEVMTSNYNTVADESGAFEDWVELYNTTDEAIDVSGYSLTDRPNSNPLMWQIPEGTIIPANDYLIIWLDEDTTDAGLHANFKMSLSGETIALSDADGFELNRVKVPELTAFITYGRFENGTGPFIRMFPTYAAENSFTALSVQKEEIISNLSLYPNPSDGLVNVVFDNADQQFVEVYNLMGELIFAEWMYANTQIAIHNWETGLYLVRIPALGLTEKLIKR